MCGNGEQLLGVTTQPLAWQLPSKAILHPVGVIVSALFVAGVLVGADSMSRAVGVPNYIADVIVATALLAMLVATLASRYRIRWGRAC